MLRAAGAFFLLALTLAITRSFDTQVSGQILFVQSTVLLLVPICMAGTNTLLLKRLPVFKIQSKFSECRGGILFSSSLTLVVSFTISLAMILFAIKFDRSELSGFIEDAGWLMPAILVLASLTTLFSFSLQALSCPLWSIVSGNLVPPLLALIGVLFATQYKVDNAFSILNVIIMSYVVSFLLAAFVLSREISFGNLNLSWLRNDISDLLYFWITTASASIASWSPAVLLGYLDNATSVAAFAIPQRLALSVLMVSFVVNAVVSPKIAQYFELNEREALLSVCQSAARWMSACAFPVLILMYLFADPVISIFGESYVESASLLRILVIAVAINIALGPVIPILVLTGLQVIAGWISIYSAVIGSVLTILLAKKLGPLGATIGLASAMIFLNVAAAFQVHRKHRTGLLLFSMRFK